MQQLEYLTVTVFSYGPGKGESGWKDSMGRSGRIDEVPGMLNDLGAQGWDLCGVVSANPLSYGYELFLKRPID